jgi:hypothetical protein
LIPSIDYYAFTLPIRAPFGEIDHESIAFAVNAFVSLISADHAHKFGTGSWGIEQAKGFYSVRLRHEISGVALSIGTINAHVFCELSGRACNNLEAIDQLIPIIRATNVHCSRIDFAIDILTETDPEHFSASRNSRAFKSNGTINSPSGKTCYFGSRSSERMARVYRYNEPHPRASYLRVEAEYKGSAAKATAKHLLETSLFQACLDAHKPFGWTHPDWDEREHKSEKIAYKAYHPSNASTVRWLYGDVITALRKAIADGLVDLDDWLIKLAGDKTQSE